jgi:multiple sugar transport system substrate-binding protein
MIVLAVFVAVLGMVSEGWAGERVLRFWHSYTQPPRIAVMKEAAADFEKANPGVRVEIEVVPWSKLYQKWTTALAAGTLPDVAIAKNAQYMAMWMAGASYPVDDVLAALGGEKAFIPGFLDRHVRFQGKPIAIPHYTIAALLIYRKDLFEQKGLKPPETWEDCLRVAAALSSPPSRYGFQQYFSGNDISGTLWPLYSFMAANGGEFFDKDGNVIFNRPENVEAVKFLIELQRVASSPAALEMEWNKDEWDVMGSGRSAMIVESLFAFPELNVLNPELGKKLGAWYLPRRKEMAGLAAPASLVLLKGKNPEDGKKWIQFLLQEDRYIKFLHSIPAGQLPVTVAASKSEKFWSHPYIQEHLKEVQIQQEVAEHAYFPGTRYGLHPYFSVIDTTKILPNMLAKIVLKKVPVEQAVAEAHAELEKTVAEMKARGAR